MKCVVLVVRNVDDEESWTTKTVHQEHLVRSHTRRVLSSTRMTKSSDNHHNVESLSLVGEANSGDGPSLRIANCLEQTNCQRNIATVASRRSVEKQTLTDDHLTAGDEAPGGLSFRSRLTSPAYRVAGQVLTELASEGR